MQLCCVGAYAYQGDDHADPVASGAVTALWCPARHLLQPPMQANTSPDTPLPPILGSSREGTSATNGVSGQALNPAAKTADAQATKDAVGKLNAAVSKYSNSSALQFSVDETTKMQVVK